MPKFAEELSALGLTQQAIAYYEAAGDVAASGDDYTQACTSYRRALTLEGQRKRARSALIRKLARTLQLAGEPEEAAELLEQLVRAEGKAADHRGVASNLGFLGMVYWESALTETGLQVVSRASAGGGDDATRFENLTNAASLACELGNVAKANGLLRSAQKLKASTTEGALARFFDVSARIKLSSGSVKAAFAEFRSAAKLVEDKPDRGLFFAVLGNYADSLELCGRFREAWEIWSLLRTRAHANHMSWREPDAALHGAACLTALGDLRHAEELVDAALKLHASSANVRIHAAVAGIPLGLLLERDDLVEACADETLIGLVLRSKEPARIGPTVAAFCQLFAARNHMGDATALLDMGLAALRTADHAYSLLAFAAEHATLDKARSGQQLLRRAADVRRDPLSLAFASYVDGRIAKRDGNRQGTCTFANSAAKRFHALEMPCWQAQALELSGNLREALEIYRRIGDLRDARRLGSLFARRKSRGDAAKGLTPRQLEIARLVAQGLSNKDVGMHLGVSEKTVNNHLQAIYARLGIASRAKLIAHILSYSP